jgi:signal recognition particle receptor subunit beta
MQMAAKIVYYGPGLCGKTTNLHHIYARTAPGSRGEMVSLETETDRTLFFDLLPLDVGVIGGFKTRVQLYTVPGQVFYNTTRKLVLKGVDGVVFVADSQRAMKDANVESFQNLKTNLAEIGLELSDLPLALQYNKRDLANILSIDELNRTLNSEGRFEAYEAVAVMGTGVFETLKAISRLTLRNLKKRMLGEERPARPIAVVAPPQPAPAARPTEPKAPLAAEPMDAEVEVEDLTSPIEIEPALPSVEPEPEVPAVMEYEPEPAAAAPQRTSIPPKAAAPPKATPPAPASPSRPTLDSFDATDVETVQEFEQALNSLDSPLPDEGAALSEASAAPRPASEGEELAEVEFAEAQEPADVDPEEVKHVRVRSNVDILSELEKLRRNATAAPVSGRPTRKTASSTGISIDDLLASSLNHRKEVNRIFEVRVPQRDLSKGHLVTIALRLEDRHNRPVGEEKTFSIELNTKPDIEKLLLSLKFHIFGK